MAQPPVNPAQRATAEPPSFISVGDIYFALFRRKWWILICTLAGLAAGGYYGNSAAPPYQTDAQLLIRYVVDTRSETGHAGSSSTQTTSSSGLADNIMNAELAILTSYDLAQMVVSNLGPERLLARYGGGANANAAASVVRNNLVVEAVPKSSIIHLTFMHKDPAIVPVVLREIIADYLLKHQAVHQAGGTSYDFLSQQTDLLRDEITQTEDELRAAKTNAGIVSLEDSDKAFSAQVAKLQDELFDSQAQLAGYQALVKADPATIAELLKMPVEKLQDYQRISHRLDLLSQQQNQYFTELGYKEANKRVVDAREEIEELKRELAEKYPALAALSSSPLGVFSQASPLGPAGIGGLIPLLSKIDILTEQLKQIWAKAASQDVAKSKIMDLERKKQIQAANYQYFATTLEQARIDEALGPGRVANISEFEPPTPPYKDDSKFKKTTYRIMGGGLLAGLALALVLEFFVDQTVKRPGEIQAQLNLRLLLSIPDIKLARRQKRAAHADPGAVAPARARSLAEPVLFPYYDTLRDRLISYFDTVQLTRKPKLVAVTSTAPGAGVSSIATGLADSLAETGDGRVLLVRMNLPPDGREPGQNGAAHLEMDDALVAEKRDGALVHENLYVVDEITSGDKRPRVLPKRFAALVPKFKASDYDYIIFDMPPVSQTSVTARLAGLVDMTVLVVRAEKTGRDMVKQAGGLLAESKATVGIVLNGTKKYIPSLLYKDFLEEA